MRKLYGYLLLLILFVAACSPTAEPTAPVGSDDPTAEPTEPAAEPEVVDNAGTVETLNVLLMESFPLQAAANVSGYFNNGCWSLEEIAVEQVDDTFVLNVRGRHSGAEMCTEALVPFEENVSLPIQGLKAGTYTVEAGEQTATFTLDIDNVLDPEESDMGNMEIKEAPVAAVDANLDVKTATLTVTIMGDFPDGCTTLHDIEVGQNQNRMIPVAVTTQRDPEMMCTMALVPYSETIEIDVSDLSFGNYSVNVNGVTANFTIPES